MRPTPDSSTANSIGDDSNSSAIGRVDYVIEGRILNTTATGPFKHELIAAIPGAISGMITKLRARGKWAQILTFRSNCLGSPNVISDLSTYLKLRYTDPSTNPVTALVFGPAVIGSSIMAPQYLQCYLGAGIESQLFDDNASALAWVDSKIYQTSEKLRWKDDYRVGNADIDEQHQELFQRAHNILHAVTNAEQAHAAMRLFEYTRTHFSFEEEYMRRLRYPELEPHRTLHQELSKKLSSISSCIAKNEMVKEDLEDFMSHWLLIHIATADKKLVDYCQEHDR